MVVKAIEFMYVYLCAHNKLAPSMLHTQASNNFLVSEKVRLKFALGDGGLPE